MLTDNDRLVLIRLIDQQLSRIENGRAELTRTGGVTSVRAVTFEELLQIQRLEEIKGRLSDQPMTATVQCSPTTVQRRLSELEDLLRRNS